MARDLAGKCALVTGAAWGIGQATALLYAAHGAKAVVADVHEHAGWSVVKQIDQLGGEAIFVESDVSKPDSCELIVTKAVEAFGHLDVAFNNAGISGESSTVGDMSIEGWNRLSLLISVGVCLSADKASFITGSYYPVDGGYLAG